MKTLAIDIETYSTVNLGRTGVYPYAEAEDFEILLFAYSVDQAEPEIVDLKQGEDIPADVFAALTDENIIKSAFNAQFERVCLSNYFNIELPVEQWRDDMIHAAYLGLPLSLSSVSSVLKLPQKKDARGKALIKYFCGEVKPTKVNGGRTRNLPAHDMDRWEQFKEYCKQDVATEVAIQKKLAPSPMPMSEWQNWFIDQRINARGVAVDLDLAQKAIECDKAYTEKRARRATQLTGLPNPKAPMQLKAWLNEHGVPMESMTKAAVTEALTAATGDAAEVLQLRQELSRSSVKKYTAMEEVASGNGRARGLIQFYGANRTGRYAGRLIQVQNLPRNSLEDLDLARQLLKAGDYETLELLFDPLPDTLSQLIRTAFIPKPGTRFIVADYSAIEARVIAWLAGEKDRLDLFANGGDIYCMSASSMFGVKVEKHGENAELRQKGKIAELACGYGGSTGALITMGALNMGLQESELKPLVDAWRNTNPMIVRFWYELDKAAQYTITTGQPASLNNLIFRKDRGALFIQLPSGRELCYPHAQIGVNRFGGSSITFKGVGENKRWSAQETYGGKLAENVTQAVARDILADAIIRLENRGFKTVMHVHDEVILEATPEQSLDEACSLMGEPPLWAANLPLNADGYECDYYKKD